MILQDRHLRIDFDFGLFLLSFLVFYLTTRGIVNLFGLPLLVFVQLC